MRKLHHYGFNLYKKGKFWMVIQEEKESKAVFRMLSYVKANENILPKLNNGNIEDYTFRGFRNHKTDGFKLKQLKNFK